MNGSNPTDDVLKCVDAAGMVGITSIEITKQTGVPNNRVTAGLVNLLYEGCVRREKDPATGHYRYWYKHERPPAGIGKRGGKPRAPRKTVKAADDDVLLVLPMGHGEHVTATLDDARALFRHLYVLFGNK